MTQATPFNALEPLPRLCVADGCEVLLATQPRYCQQRGVCSEHSKADCLRKRGTDDKLWRFCQQCGKLEPLELFDGPRRSCRMQLARRRAASFRQPNAPRTSSAAMATASTNPTAFTTAYTVGAMLRPVRSGVRKASSLGSMEAWVQHSQQQLMLQQQQAEVTACLISCQNQLAQVQQQLAHIGNHPAAKAQCDLLQQRGQVLLKASQDAQQQLLLWAHEEPEAAVSHAGLQLLGAQLQVPAVLPAAVPMLSSPGQPLLMLPQLSGSVAIRPAAVPVPTAAGAVGTAGLNGSTAAVAAGGYLPAALQQQAQQSSPQLMHSCCSDSSSCSEGSSTGPDHPQPLPLLSYGIGLPLTAQPQLPTVPMAHAAAAAAVAAPVDSPRPVAPAQPYDAWWSATGSFQQQQQQELDLLSVGLEDLGELLTECNTWGQISQELQALQEMPPAAFHSSMAASNSQPGQAGQTAMAVCTPAPPSAPTAEAVHDQPGRHPGGIGGTAGSGAATTNAAAAAALCWQPAASTPQPVDGAAQWPQQALADIDYAGLLEELLTSAPDKMTQP